MALQTSGAISLNDIHIEAGGTTGTSASINDADIRALISKGSAVQMSFSEWYGASASYAYSTRGLHFTGMASNGRYLFGQFTGNSSDHIAVASTNQNQGTNTWQFNLYDYTDGTRTALGYSSVGMIHNHRPVNTNDGGAIIIAPTTGVQSTDFFNANYNRHSSGILIMYKFSSSGSVSWKLQLDNLTGKRPTYGCFAEGDYIYMYYNGAVASGSNTRYIAKIDHTDGSIEWKKTGSFTSFNSDNNVDLIYLHPCDISHCQDVDMSSYLCLVNGVPNASSSSGQSGENYIINKSDGSQVTSAITNYPTSYTSKTITGAPSGWLSNSTPRQRFGNSDDNITWVDSVEDVKLPGNARHFFFHNDTNYAVANDTWIGTSVNVDKRPMNWIKDQTNADHWWTNNQVAYGNITASVTNNRKFATDFKLAYAGDDYNQTLFQPTSAAMNFADFKLAIHLEQPAALTQMRDLTNWKGGMGIIEYIANYSDNTHKGFWGIVDADTANGDAMTVNNSYSYLPSSSNKKFSYKRDTGTTEIFDGSDLRTGYTFGSTTWYVYVTTAISSYGNLSNSNCLVSTSSNSITTGTNSTHNPTVTAINL